MSAVARTSARVLSFLSVLAFFLLIDGQAVSEERHHKFEFGWIVSRQAFIPHPVGETKLAVGVFVDSVVKKSGVVELGAPVRKTINDTPPNEKESRIWYVFLRLKTEYGRRLRIKSCNECVVAGLIRKYSPGCGDMGTVTFFRKFFRGIISRKEGKLVYYRDDIFSGRMTAIKGRNFYLDVKASFIPRDNLNGNVIANPRAVIGHSRSISNYSLNDNSAESEKRKYGAEPYCYDSIICIIKRPVPIYLFFFPVALLLGMPLVLNDLNGKRESLRRFKVGLFLIVAGSLGTGLLLFHIFSKVIYAAMS